MTRVLVVGMLDSVHLARWLKQFNEYSGRIEVFPSARFRAVHPELVKLANDKHVDLQCWTGKTSIKFAGYFDFLKYEILSKILKTRFSRASSLSNCLRENKYDLVHLIEMQHAGYLFLEADGSSIGNFKVVTTNYGSDLIFFKSNQLHTDKIRKLLSVSDFYSAECRRDYKLAKELGFSGVELPLMPNAGGFNEALIVSEKARFRDRRTIYVKGYGLTFGLGQISLDVSRRLLERYAHIDIVVVSVTEDLMELAAGLLCDFGSRVTIHSAKKGLSHDRVIQILSSSLISIGASKSDGISTTFLESLVCGAIPIQTDTSCANEWIDKGFFARVVSPVEETIYAACCEIISDPEHFELHTLRNSELSLEHLSNQGLKQIAIGYYPEVVG